MREWSKRELLTYLDRVEPALDRLDHFELLDVAASADKSAIQSAFHEMAAGLHPDRHRRQLTPQQYERLTIVYARIAEAYRVLRNPEHREEYLKGKQRERLDQKTPSAPARKPAAAKRRGSGPPELAILSPKAQQLYRRAQAALRSGDRTSAMLNLRMALNKHPTSDFLKQALRSARES
jgi:curved DNA-binding protein CbpA